MSNEREFQQLLDSQKAQNKPPATGYTMTNQDSRKEWEEKLVGKKYSQDPASTSAASSTTWLLSECTSFTKRDLPEKHRIILPEAMVKQDFYPDRLNIHLDEDGTCSHVTMG